jgi:hypothetical protein
MSKVVYIHAVNPHYSATWADFAFSENGRWNWMICSTKEFPLEPVYNLGCLISCEALAVAVYHATQLVEIADYDKIEVIPPPGANTKRATEGSLFLEYEEYQKHPDRFLDRMYDPQGIRTTKEDT